MGELLGRFGRTRTIGAVAAAVAALVALGVALVALGGDDNTTAKPDATPAAATATATNTSTPTPTPEPSPTPITHPGILDGLAMSDAEWDARKDLLPLAVMIDNTSGGYPQAGISQADLVYEAFVEGGITRLMAVFWRREADLVLPVRSARTPFVNWVAELGALYGHAGGASTENDANAIGQIYELKLKDLNAFSPVSSNYYYRDADRVGPYDLATSTAFLREAADQLGFSGTPAVESWSFREPGTPLPPGKPARGIEVDFSGRLYAWQYIQWKWDAQSKRYLRFQFGGPHMDASTGQQLTFATVVVMRVPSQVVDDVGHVVLDQVGSGPVTVFTGGQAYTGTWKKPSKEGRTRFLDESGKDIVFERGPIFIEAIGLDSGFEFTADAGDLRPLPEYVPPPPGSFTPDAEETPTPTDTPPSPTTGPSPSPSPATTPTRVPTTSVPQTPKPTATVPPPTSSIVASND